MSHFNAIHVSDEEDRMNYPNDKYQSDFVPVNHY